MEPETGTTGGDEIQLGMKLFVIQFLAKVQGWKVESRINPGKLKFHFWAYREGSQKLVFTHNGTAVHIWIILLHLRK